MKLATVELDAYVGRQVGGGREKVQHIGKGIGGIHVQRNSYSPGQYQSRLWLFGLVVSICFIWMSGGCVLKESIKPELTFAAANPHKDLEFIGLWRGR